jgi:hypothetical protein
VGVLTNGPVAIMKWPLDSVSAFVCVCVRACCERVVEGRELSGRFRVSVCVRARSGTCGVAGGDRFDLEEGE